MDRRDFIRNSIVAATGMALTGAATPLSTENAKTKSLKQLKALLINGSPNKNGNTACSLAEVAKSLRTAGIKVENLWIGRKPVHGCAACYVCKKTGRCVFNDDPCNKIVEKIAEADAVVVGTPVYYGQPNGALLALIQRAMMTNPTGVAGKPVAGVAVCRRGGSTASAMSPHAVRDA